MTYYERHKEKIKAYQRQQYADDPEKHREARRASGRRWRAANKARANAYSRKYYREHKEKWIGYYATSVAKRKDR